MWQILQLFVSFLTITSMWLAGNKSIYAWILGIINQFFWVLLLVIHLEQYGLLPIPIILLVVYIRNLIKWVKERE